MPWPPLPLCRSDEPRPLPRLPEPLHWQPLPIFWPMRPRPRPRRPRFSSPRPILGHAATIWARARPRNHDRSNPGECLGRRDQRLNHRGHDLGHGLGRDLGNHNHGLGCRGQCLCRSGVQRLSRPATSASAATTLAAAAGTSTDAVASSAPAAATLPQPRPRAPSRRPMPRLPQP